MAMQYVAICSLYLTGFDIREIWDRMRDHTAEMALVQALLHYNQCLFREGLSVLRGRLNFCVHWTCMDESQEHIFTTQAFKFRFAALIRAGVSTLVLLYAGLELKDFYVQVKRMESVEPEAELEVLKEQYRSVEFLMRHMD